MRAVSTALRSHLSSRQPFYKQRLQEMVAVNSYTRNPAGVDAVGRLTEALFAGIPAAQIGLAERPQTANGEFGRHLALTSDPHGRHRRKIALVSHLDTVFPADTPFAWNADPATGRIYGPGTMDIKGGTVMMAMVVDALSTVAPEVYGSLGVELLFNAAEEGMQSAPCFLQLCQRRIGGGGGGGVSGRSGGSGGESGGGSGCLGALVFESGNYDPSGRALVVTDRPGMCVWRLHVRGVEAHAGNGHHGGVNSIAAAARCVLDLQALTDYSRALTVNVGTIRGGVVHNTVPGYTSAEVEVRARCPVVFRQGVAAVLAVVDGANSASEAAAAVAVAADAAAGAAADAAAGVAADVAAGAGAAASPAASAWPAGAAGASLRLQELVCVPPWGRNEGSDGLLGVWQRAALLAVGADGSGGCRGGGGGAGSGGSGGGGGGGAGAVREERGGLSDGNLLWQECPTVDGLGMPGRNAHCAGMGDGPMEYADWGLAVDKAHVNCLAILLLVQQEQEG